jgi:L-amino acid N-acyltransferase YncA/RimJ/RimL family protein N-acetyltransferase
MPFEIRPGTPEDAAGIAAVWAAAMPYLVKTAAGIEAELRTSKARRVLIAVEDGTVVGYANAWLPAPEDRATRIRVSVQVPPAERERGIGGALAEAITRTAQQAGGHELLTVIGDDDASRGFATRRGFTIGRKLTHARVSLAAVPEPAPVPDGLRLVDYDSLDPRQVWTASAAVAEGDPSGLSGATPYDEWFATDWNHPDLRRDLSIALLDGDTVVSFVTTTADPARGVIWSNLTGTIASHRGRGLAKVVKSTALTRSRDAGLTDAFTGNDAGNVPMLAVNQWLGYQSTASNWTAGKTI